MAYSLVRIREQEDPKRVIGSNVYFDNLPAESSVFIFYYPNPGLYFGELEARMKSYGQQTGDQIFVNMGRIGDKNYSRLVNEFRIDPLPVVIITGRDTVAMGQTDIGLETAYVRIDNKSLFKNLDRALNILGQIVNLYLSGRIAEGYKRAKNTQRTAILYSIKNSILAVLKSIEEISIDFVSGGFTLKRNTGEPP